MKLKIKLKLRSDTEMELGSVESSLHIALNEVGVASMGHGLHLEPLSQYNRKSTKTPICYLNVDVVVNFDVVVRSPAHGTLVTGNTFWLALCACPHPGLA